MKFRMKRGRFRKEFDSSIGNKKFNIGALLESHQLTELMQLLNDFPDVFSDKLGRTDLIEHEIKVKNPKPCVSTPYKVPEALQPAVEREIERLLTEGILIESDSSTYAAPLVVVTKKGPDGKPNDKLRLCGDYRYLNVLSEDDVFMTNNPANVLRRAANCKYLSKIDLSV
jgi:hypothetical protein